MLRVNYYYINQGSFMDNNRGWIISKTVTVSTKKDQSYDNEQFNYDPVVGVYTISWSYVKDDNDVSFLINDVKDDDFW